MDQMGCLQGHQGCSGTALEGHDKVYGESPLGGPVQVLECQKGDWKQPAWSYQQRIVPDDIDCLL